MRRHFLTLLIAVSTPSTADNSYLPYEFKSGDEVIFSLNQQGKLLKSNVDNFCSVFKGNQSNVLQDYQERFGKGKSDNLDIRCNTALNNTIKNLKSIGSTRCIENPFDNNSVAELCIEFKKWISQYKPQLNFFSDAYTRIKLEQHQQELDSIEQSNSALLASIEKQNNERLSFCDVNYQKVKDNDLKGVKITKSLLDTGSEAEQLKAISKYKYLSPNMDDICMKQERYKTVLDQVNESKNLLKNQINQLKQKQREIVIVQQAKTEPKPDKKVYQSSSNLLESGANVPKGVQENPQALTQMVSLIRLTGYKCDSISAVREMMLSRGFTVVCNNFYYEYDIEDKGGNWIVTLQL